MKHQMFLVVQADKIEELMKFQQEIVEASVATGVTLRKLEIKPVDER